MIEQSPDERQDFITGLGAEDGLATVRQIVESDFAKSYSVLGPMFQVHCVLFLKLITHESILSSLALERQMGTIYNVIYGPNGRRAVAFFNRVTEHLFRMKPDTSNGHKKSTGNDSSQFEEALLLVSKAFLSTLTLNQEASIRTEFRDIVERLCSSYDAASIFNGVASHNLRWTHDNLMKLKDVLFMGESLEHSHSFSSQQGNPRQLPKVRFQVDLPGKLSVNGPRHDNDHSSIPNIRILPTISEIFSIQRAEFLPARDPAFDKLDEHETGIRRLLDCQFRLLREDTAGLLRDSIRMILDNWDILVHRSDWQLKRRVLRDSGITPVRIYLGVEIQRVQAGGKKGIEIDLEFDQPPRLKFMNATRRKQWWQTSQALKEAPVILALVDGEDLENVSVTFLQVSRRNLNVNYDPPAPQATVPAPIRDLVNSGTRAMISVRLTNGVHESELTNIFNFARHKSGKRPLMLVEFPAVLLNSFDGVLQCMQHQYTHPEHLPFATWIVPRPGYNCTRRGETTDMVDEFVTVPPPSYIHESNYLDLSCLFDNLVADSGSEYSTNDPRPSFSLQDDPAWLANELAKTTSLDKGQAKALVWALRREIALIQGPPGTGKSYVGIQLAKCLSANREQLELGPILCVCYTAHALDQFLQGLLDAGITSIVRLGPRSVFPQLEALSLDNHRQAHRGPFIRGYNDMRNANHDKLKEINVKLEEVCQLIEKGGIEMTLWFVKKRFPYEADRITSVDPERSETESFNLWLKSDDSSAWVETDEERSPEELMQSDVWTLSPAERTRLYEFWHGSALDELRKVFSRIVKAYYKQKKNLTAIYHVAEARMLQEFQIIGVTTTMLANLSSQIRSVRAKVLICEEAGEVLESHVLTALLSSVQHAILIGDHLQLRPRISNLRLSISYDGEGAIYGLDESLFERLANSHFVEAHDEQAQNNGRQFPITQLNIQRRMHPSVAHLVRETLYPELQDHSSTTVYPAIPGLKRRLFWLDHRNEEDAGDPSDPMHSKTNTWEVHMVTSLVRHLLRQGKYGPGEIAVLTPYVGQLRMLRDILEQEMTLIIGERDADDLGEAECTDTATDPSGKNERWFQGPNSVRKASLLNALKLATVDNFQGDEATVVIVSLVRSNKFRNCGFLKSPNRINVLLSRAKHGMYLIGDANTASTAPMWSSVIELMEKNENIGPYLELECERHPKNKIEVACPDDFTAQSPEGGCAETCGLRLDCGHTCMIKCHSARQHKAVKCFQNCYRMHKCGHPCARKCYEPCGPCTAIVPSVTLPCGHATEGVECHRMSRLSTVRCTVDLTIKLPWCDHNTKAQCHERGKPVKCSIICGMDLPCGHKCQKLCSLCRIHHHGMTIVDHGKCISICRKRLTNCTHTCDRICHPETACSPCRRPCEVHCKHSRCPKLCKDPCPPCAEPCDSGCDHREACTLPCAVPCENNPCNRRCEKMLKLCGHRCPGMCGEPCPPSRFCQICAPPEVLQQQVDLLELKTYSEVDIDTSPLLFLPCNHFYTIASLDGLLGLNEYFDIDPATNNILGPKPSHWEMMPESALKGCPECRRPLRDINRYSRILKKALLDEFTRKFVTLASSQNADIADKIATFEKQIDSARTDFLQYWTLEAGKSKSLDQVKAALYAYRIAGKKLHKKVVDFIKSVRTSEQPLSKMNDMLASATLRENKSTAKAPMADDSMIQTGFGMRGHVLSLRLSWAVLRDFDHICNNQTIDHRVRENLVQLGASQLKKLIDKCVLLRNSTVKANLLQERVETGIYFALFSMLSLSNMRTHSKRVEVENGNKTRQRAQEELTACERLCNKLPKLLGYLLDDIEDARKTINDGTFYALVTSEEKRQVYRAMAEQFGGTGHWYYCANNHPFAIGECGLPMEEARCPQCEAPVGGLNHQLAEIARPAEDIDREFGETELTEQEIREGMIMEELREELMAGDGEENLMEL
ncbi:uncharacterized protein BP01DRAFT_331171 [Aspergillus saccharolyticus JOP 1030-1]|uniref:RZ-type domain-containing protein n=1 Tax=Aspergillus saccharolyticus JOP 1030-1 TaxID=1450539 RepID=A0A318ZRQ8_9EURO|nr:hypothetical protein BP01DRAFT_331171 [Aspergillus saccharolyticus JOP 1030-1]PYH49757.1 hypothetical protein BP01DRAFT_331171 [Aspergillus saccharolyticus JOP 1030-1]